MRRFIVSAIFCLLALASAVVPASAATTAFAGAGVDQATLPLPSGWPQLRAGGEEVGSAGGPVQLAFNRIIRIGPRGNKFYSWRCAVTVNGNRYYSVGISEGSARARLSTITNKRFYCKRARRGLFF